MQEALQQYKAEAAVKLCGEMNAKAKVSEQAAWVAFNPPLCLQLLTPHDTDMKGSW